MRNISINMDSVQIKNVMQLNLNTTKLFRGVYACDRLPRKIISKPCFLIINTDPANKPGTHWIAIYIPKKGKAEYFDSYGNPPYIKLVINFMLRHSIGYKYNTNQLQSMFSSCCGIYCCEYVLHRCLGYSLKSFLSKFTKSTIQNDRKIIYSFQKHFLKIEV